jgi:hypothetical protein
MILERDFSIPIIAAGTWNEERSYSNKKFTHNLHYSA